MPSGVAPAAERRLTRGARRPSEASLGACASSSYAAATELGGARYFAVDRGSLNKEEEAMAVAIDMKFHGATLEQYDKIIQLMGLKQGGPTPPGAISHFVIKTDDGIRVVDVWESKEVFEQFAQEQIGPYSREAGITEEPEMRFFEVHNYLTKS
jgi:hypothetical protein